MLTLYISEALDCDRSRVFSETNPVPVPMSQMVFGNSEVAELYIVDGQGDFSDVSGQDGSIVQVGIGDLTSEDPVWLTTSWTRITNGWRGVIAATGDELEALFLGRNVFFASLRVRVTDANDHPKTYAALPFKLSRLGISDAAEVETPDESMNGQFPIPEGVDQVTVTGLGLLAIPRRVIATVRKPSGGANLFSSLVDDSVSADGFTVDLDGETDSADYILDYVIFF